MTATTSGTADALATSWRSGRRTLLARVATFALALGLWITPIPSGLTEPGLAPLRHLRGGDLLRHPDRVPAADRRDAGGGRRGAHRHDHARQGLRRLRQRQRAPRGGGLSRRQQCREVRAGAAHQLPGRERLRSLHARAGLQHLPHRRGDRSGLSEQHRAQRRALSDRPVTRPGGGLDARGREDAPRRRLSHVLRHGEPRRLLGALADGHVRESDRGGDRAAVRPEDQLRLVAARRVRSGAGCGAAPSSGAVLAVSAGRARDPRCARPLPARLCGRWAR